MKECVDIYNNKETRLFGVSPIRMETALSIFNEKNSYPSILAHTNTLRNKVIRYIKQKAITQYNSDWIAFLQFLIDWKRQTERNQRKTEAEFMKTEHLIQEQAQFTVETLKKEISQKDETIVRGIIKKLELLKTIFLLIEQLKKFRSFVLTKIERNSRKKFLKEFSFEFQGNFYFFYQISKISKIVHFDQF